MAAAFKEIEQPWTDTKSKSFLHFQEHNAQVQTFIFLAATSRGTHMILSREAAGITNVVLGRPQFLIAATTLING